MATIEQTPLSRSDPAADVWRTFWSALDDFVADVRRMLGSHLRSDTIELRAIGGDRDPLRGSLTVGATRIHLECPRACRPASRSEAPIASIFGTDRPLVRIFVLDGSGAVESMVVADPSTRVWITTEPELGPASLGDLVSLEPFFWSLLLDRR